MRNYNVNNLYFSSVNNIYTFLDQMALIRVQFPAKYVHMKFLSEHFRVLVLYSYSNFIILYTELSVVIAQSSSRNTNIVPCILFMTARPG
jgi:hypothetical protein